MFSFAILEAPYQNFLARLFQDALQVINADFHFLQLLKVVFVACLLLVESVYGKTEDISKAFLLQA